ncbi:MAG: hypothetical protein ACUVTN_03755 [Thermodesulfobacteriota bacterium]
MPNRRFLAVSKGIAFICCVVMVAGLACVPKAPKERVASLTVMPTSARASAIIIINGYQFLPGEEVEITMQVGDVYHGLGTEKADIIVADEKGRFEVKSGVPVKTPPGMYKITAIGNKGSMGTSHITVIK